ncbi:cyclase family protein [Erythrobacter mangrovi]|uniref:Cyclase family protein n=1 Tax=Erythrobacter mangrovi TaxID=2739433 RepID=A0A7D4CCC4_9SPHN|nr:cyclase family protein [Erythrobacter mangrovi]QKG70629.1 cyclase family protein [Erythrobacter mangrovi]
METEKEWRLVDLSHEIEEGMETYIGLPGPHICDFYSRETSAANFDDGSSFLIGRIDMVSNTGTYVDAPFHRFVDGKDLAGLPLESLADLEAIVVRRPFEHGLATEAEHLDGLDVQGKAVLIATGWDRHWRNTTYFTDHPYLTESAARFLAERGASFVGIDSHNIDDTRVRARPVHTTLLGADIPIGEHLTNLDDLPDAGFRFHAVPPKIVGFGTFPVRAYAKVGSGQ